MAITRETNGMLSMLDTPEPPHVALVHRMVVDSHNAGHRCVVAHELNSEIWPVLAEVTYEQVVQELLALDQDGILEVEEEGEQNYFVHTSTPGFRLEAASTAYRAATEDLHLAMSGDLYKLLDHADDVMRAVKSAGKDPSQAGKLLERLKKS